MEPSVHILLVEDDENFGSLLQNYLQLSGYQVTWAKNGQQAYSLLMTSSFDLCILDVMMPELDGFTLGAMIKEKKLSIPFLYLSAKKMKEDLIAGYKLGAQDYIVKPFDVEVLLLKLQAILKRNTIETQQKTPEIVHFQIGGYSFDSSNRKLSLNGDDIKLSPKEGALLKLLCQHQNEVMPRTLALTQIWGEETYFTKRSMDVYITKLRKYLKQDENIKIETVHSSGFQLIAP